MTEKTIEQLNSELQQENDRLVNENAILRDNNDNLTRNNVELKEVVTELKDEHKQAISQQKKELSLEKQQVDELTVKLKQFDENYRRSVLEYLDENGKLLDKNRELQEQLAAIENQFQIKSFNKEAFYTKLFEEKELNINNLEYKVKTKDIEKNKQTTLIKELQDKITLLNQSNEQLLKENKGKTHKSNNLPHRLDSQKKQLTDLHNENTKLKQLQNQINHIEMPSADIENLSKLKDKIDILSEQLIEANEKIKRLTKIEPTKKITLADALKSDDDSDKIEELKKQVEEKNKQINSLEDKLEQLNQHNLIEKEKYNEELGSLRTANDKFKEQQNIDKETISNLKNDILIKNQELNDANKNLNALTNQV
ncbi:hypothetical protein, partial [Cysteiniphilum sp. 6C5]